MGTADGLSNPGIANPVANPATNTTYRLSVLSDKGCTATGKITVLGELPLLMPSTFTPNGDGRNDVFRIPPGVRIALDEFAVYDRWGNKIFVTKDLSNGWDGTYNSIPAGTGTYIYLVKGKTTAGQPVF